MRTILIIGSGKSTSYLIKYLLDNSISESLNIRLADKDSSLGLKLLNNHSNGTFIEFDIFNKKQRETEIKNSDIVISMLPARYHIEVAKDCLKFGKNMVSSFLFLYLFLIELNLIYHLF